VMIDDNQVQSLRVSWLDPAPGSPNMKFRLALQALSPDEYLRREGLFFVEFSPERCFPVFSSSSETVGVVVQTVDVMLKFRQELLAAGEAASDADLVLPAQRFFPRSRLGRFDVRHSTDFL